MKAQASTEYLLVSAIALAVLAVSVGALVKIKETAGKTQGILMLKDDAEAVYNAAQEACAMGSGNARTVTLNQKTLVESDGSAISFSNEETSISKNLSCESGLDGWLEGKVMVVNEDGVVKKK